MDTITRILVSGTERYLAALLALALTRQGYEVIGLDTGFSKGRTLYEDGGTTPLNARQAPSARRSRAREGCGCRPSHGRTAEWIRGGQLAAALGLRRDNVIDVGIPYDFRSARRDSRIVSAR